MRDVCATLQPRRTNSPARAAGNGCKMGTGGPACVRNRPQPITQPGKGNAMADSVYKVVELVGTSSESWEKAAANAVETASKSLRDLRIATVEELDLQVEEGKVVAYRTKVKLSFKYHQGED